MKQVPTTLFKKLGAHARVILQHHITSGHQLEFKKSLTCSLYTLVNPCLTKRFEIHKKLKNA